MDNWMEISFYRLQNRPQHMQTLSDVQKFRLLLLCNDICDEKCPKIVNFDPVLHLAVAWRKTYIVEAPVLS